MPDLPFDEPPATRGPAPPARRILSVSELTTAIRGLLESSYGEVWVDGEISNCRLWNTGHLYFTLKDSGAQLRAVMFRSTVRYLRFKPEDGLRVVARGRISVYEPKGEYQIVCEHMEPHGVGALQLAFEQLKRRLEAEGLFDSARKRSLPALPRKIGVVTSLDGAALRDIVKVLRRRYPNAHVLICPSRVQGEGAAADIARALAQVSAIAGVDVIIVGRGGGSIEDLWAFNEEAVARAIAASSVPVISAVGHQTDVTIADFVADLRAPTPSAAAELVVTRKDEYASRIDRLRERLRASALTTVRERRASVQTLERRPGLAGWPARVALQGRHVSELSHDLARVVRASVAKAERRYHQLRLALESRDLRRTVASITTRLVSADAQLWSAIRRGASDRRAAHIALTGRLETLSPLGVLARGYAVCWNADRSVVITDSNSVTPGQLVRVTLHRGELGCEVKERHQ